MWKFQHFSVTQILREITVDITAASKIAILTCLEALNFDLYGFLHFVKAEMDQK